MKVDILMTRIICPLGIVRQNKPIGGNFLFYTIQKYTIQSYLWRLFSLSSSVFHKTYFTVYSYCYILSVWVLLFIPHVVYFRVWLMLMSSSSRLSERPIRSSTQSSLWWTRYSVLPCSTTSWVPQRTHTRHSVHRWATFSAMTTVAQGQILSNSNLFPVVLSRSY